VTGQRARQRLDDGQTVPDRLGQWAITVGDGHDAEDVCSFRRATGGVLQKQ
jgi:hypothetical protein